MDPTESVVSFNLDLFTPVDRLSNYYTRHTMRNEKITPKRLCARALFLIRFASVFVHVDERRLKTSPVVTIISNIIIID